MLEIIKDLDPSQSIRRTTRETARPLMILMVSSKSMGILDEKLHNVQGDIREALRIEYAVHSRHGSLGYLRFSIRIEMEHFSYEMHEFLTIGHPQLPSSGR